MIVCFVYQEAFVLCKLLRVDVAHHSESERASVCVREKAIESAREKERESESVCYGRYYFSVICAGACVWRACGVLRGACLYVLVSVRV